MAEEMIPVDRRVFAQRRSRESGNPEGVLKGSQPCQNVYWIPAFAGMTG
jgi:hypothetical protein